ncbi:MAG: hypothetical protein QOE55_2140 [Acidobacteriaceae bacterium]|jgi:hypothetical protein|nr:hypothetical protein [Acidobacteriaceae bacterium]
MFNKITLIGRLVVLNVATQESWRNHKAIRPVSASATSRVRVHLIPLLRRRDVRGHDRIYHSKV